MNDTNLICSQIWCGVSVLSSGTQAALALTMAILFMALHIAVRWNRPTHQ